MHIITTEVVIFKAAFIDKGKDTMQTLHIGLNIKLL